MNKKILPCPFCKSIKGVKCEDGNLGWYIGCWNIFCMFQPGASFDSKKKAIKAWNRSASNDL